MSAQLTAYQQAMLEAIARELRIVLDLDGDVVESPLSSIEYAVAKTGDVTRAAALTGLADCALTHRDAEARRRIEDAMVRIRAIPNPAPPPVPPPPPPLPLRVNTMRPGVRYRVVQSFRTFDGDTIAAGQVLTYVGYDYSPREGGYAVSFEELDFRLSDGDDDNRAVLHNRDCEYFAAADD